MLNSGSTPRSPDQPRCNTAPSRFGPKLGYGRLPTAHLIEKGMNAGDACGYLGLLFRTRLRGKPGQRGDGWINLAHHALLDDGEKELPHILRREKKSRRAPI